MLLFLPLNSFAADSSEVDAKHLLKGKICLDNGSYDDAIAHLTTAYQKLPLLGDYALMWRARAFEGKDNIEQALADLKAIKEKYKESPLIKNVRIKEIELLQKKSDSNVISLFDSFIRDYPSDMNIKYAYATHLKANNASEKAKKLFREIFASTSPYAKHASNELSSSDISAEDLLKKGTNLNKAWLFGESEKFFRDALKRDANDALKEDIINGLAYSLFGQKQYKEASELYKETNNYYWQSRSLLRAKDQPAFESKLPRFMETGDKRLAPVLIAYGNIKRRDGDTEKALKILNTVLKNYPSEKEGALWAIGWTYYLSQDYKKASEIFSQLHEIHGDSKYLYWKNKCYEMSGESKITKVSYKKQIQYRDFYAFLSMLKEEQQPPIIEDNFIKVSTSSASAERIDVLTKLGFRQEAVSELLHLSRKNPSQGMLVYISSYLKKLGHYKMSVNIVSKGAYNDELHELYYPLAFQSEIEEASKKNGIDPLLILAVMREESRFDPEARSIAGALGLMQLMPQTAHRFDKHVRINLKNADDLYCARTNILIGSYYLKQLLKTFNSIPVAIAAYNAGEDAVKEWLRKGSYRTIDEFIEDIPYDETRNYVKKVLISYFEYLRTNKDMDMPATKKHIGKL